VPRANRFYNNHARIISGGLTMYDQTPREELEDVQLEYEVAGTQNRWTRYATAVFISIIIVCAALAFLGRLFENDKIGESDYPIKDFTLAASALDVEPVDEWRTETGRGFSASLPERLRVATESETQDFTGMVVSMGDELFDTEVDFDEAMNEDNLMILVLDQSYLVGGINITIARLAGSGTESMSYYVKGISDQFKPLGATITDRSVYTLGGKEMGRIIIQMEVVGIGVSGVQFLRKDSRSVWAITGSAPSADFENWLPIFETVAREFEIN
jgi:hypothetical protein